MAQAITSSHDCQIQNRRKRQQLFSCNSFLAWGRKILQRHTLPQDFFSHLFGQNCPPLDQLLTKKNNNVLKKKKHLDMTHLLGLERLLSWTSPREFINKKDRRSHWVSEPRVSMTHNDDYLRLHFWGHLQPTRLVTKCFTCIISFNLCNHPMYPFFMGWIISSPGA